MAKAKHQAPGGAAAAVEALPENPAPQPWTEEIW